MRQRKELYLGLIAVLYHQLGEIPPDFFVDIVSQSNFLTSTLQVDARIQMYFHESWDKNLQVHRNETNVECFSVKALSGYVDETFLFLILIIK